MKFILTVSEKTYICEDQPTKNGNLIIATGTTEEYRFDPSTNENIKETVNGTWQFHVSETSDYSLVDEDGENVEFAAPLPTGEDRLQAIESAMLTMLSGGM